MPQQQRERAIVIAGPTASGKSQLALALAERLGGSIINADSMQVYRELALLTARPGASELARVPHALYGCVSGREAYSAGRYAADAASAVAVARAAGRRPIIVGGTGLYLRALLQGLSPVPAADPAVRAHWRQQVAARGSEELHALLASRDPAMAARLKPSDPQRIVRALEVLDSTGRSLADWQRQAGRPVLAAGETTPLLLLPPPASHAAAIAERFQRMLGAGALEEVRQLVALGLSPELPIMRALGVAALSSHLAGQQSLTAAAAAATTATRQYAKRQMTWFRRNMISWKTFESQETESFIKEILAFIDA
ncbi:MAG TPA: tRNA (adenosine(37)-N6)-dimethylallyltransferase MiaA [Hyphomicrobiaceae bacterium]|jgi:tRNA dimethylallyltransferase|nr:tRNA (adenosine(37)-N6)-dimethylallyltransferase MiaA [Hyphomicrobiaceae bacterium]